MKIKVLIATLVIIMVPLLQAALYQPINDNVQDFYFFYLRTSQFEKLAELIKTSKSIDIPQVENNQYFYGNKLAEFSCFLGDSEHIVEAYNYWIKLISTAVSENKLDSAVFLAESFAKNIPLDYSRNLLQVARIAEKEKAQKKDS